MPYRIALAIALLASACALDTTDDAPPAPCPGIITPNHPPLVCIDGRWALHCETQTDCTDPHAAVCVSREIEGVTVHYCAATPE